MTPKATQHTKSQSDSACATAPPSVSPDATYVVTTANHYAALSDSADLMPPMQCQQQIATPPCPTALTCRPLLNPLLPGPRVATGRPHTATGLPRHTPTGPRNKRTASQPRHNTRTGPVCTRGVRFYRFSGFYRFALFTVRKTGSF